jgi:hypothetical protein
MLEVFQGRIAGNHQTFDGAAENMILDPSPDISGSKYRPKPFQSRHRHARARDAKSNVRFGTGVVEPSGDGGANIVRGTRIDAAEITLLKVNTFPDRIYARAYGYAIDRYALVVS